MIRETHKRGTELGVAAVPPQANSYTINALTEQVPFLFPGDQGEPVEVEAKVTYRGITDRTYTTRQRGVFTVARAGGPRLLVVDEAMDEG